MVVIRNLMGKNMNKLKTIGIILNKNVKKVENIENLNEEEILYARNPFYKCPDAITKSIIRYGGFPLFMIYDEDFSDKYLEMIDGLLLIGDKDISKSFYLDGEFEEDVAEIMNKDKMKFQIKMLDKILIKKEKDIPVLAICGGSQSLNIALGGTLYTDIKDETSSHIIHNPRFTNPKKKAHKVKINKGTILYDILQKEEIETTSNHHQAIKNLGRGLNVCANCIEDNIVESIEYKNSKFCLGIQWHIEREADENDSKILKRFLETC